jgi:carboxymethylenebutenolidase
MVKAEEIQVSTPDGPMALYDANAEGKARGGVVVIQEAFGVNDHIKDVARRFADAGYHSVAPDLFHRRGGGSLPYDDLTRVREMLEGLSDDAILADVDAAVGRLREAGWPDNQIGIVGFCMGGRVTFLTAVRRALGAAVTFYGGGIVRSGWIQWPSLVEEAATLKTPWLGLFGDKDPSIPVEDVERLRKETAGAPVPTEVVRYPDAGHGFHCDQRESYHAESASDGWKRTLAWYEKHLARA